MKTIIIGAGGIAEPHAKALAKLGVKIVGVFDVNRDSAHAFASKYGGRVIADLGEALGETEMIHLLTPPTKRVEYVRLAAAAGKHIFIEKPIAVSIADAEEIVSAARENGVKLMVDFNHRFRDGFLMLKEALDDGTLGDAVSVYSHRYGSGHGFRGAFAPSWRTKREFLCGMCIESLSHDIDMMLQLAGDIETVSANVSESIAGLPGFDNNASVTFKTRKGAIGSIHASWSSHLGHSERGVIGTRGSAVISGNDLFSFEDFTIRTDDMAYPRTTRVSELFSLTDDHSFYRTNMRFLECIKSGAEPPASGEDGLRALRVSHAILESARQGKVITINI
jgi:myo-inositol 2-dehydrogenase/D-chiro-inositol 1-dehydrogenase